MASTREERLQMRQRGAGTREIKAVDFGFSFGGPALGPSEPAPLSIVPEPDAPTISTPPTLQGSQRFASQSKGKQQRTPGSARNSLPQRPSTYDIPSDDIPVQPRSNKRRKPNPPDAASDTPSRQIASQSRNGNSVPSGNRETGDTEVQALDALVADAPQPMVEDNAPEPQPSPLPEPSINNTRRTDKSPETNGGRTEASATSREQPTSRPGTPSGRARSPKAPLHETQAVAEQPKARPSSRGRGKSRSPPQPGNSGQEYQEERAKRVTQKSTSPITRKTTGSTTGALREHVASARATEVNPTQEPDATDVEAMVEEGDVNIEDVEPTSTAIEASPKPKRPRGRPSLTKKTTEVKNRPQSQAEHRKPTKRPRGRPSLAKKAAQAEGDGDENVPPNEATEATEATVATTEAPSKPKRSRGRPSLARKAAETTEVEDQSNSPVVPTQTTGESSGTAARRGRKKKAETRPEPEVDAEVEEPQAQEPETEPSPEARPGRTAKKTKRPTEAKPSPTEEQPEGEAPQKTRRKTREREPRGETVPVTVHRLTNASALGSMYADEAGGEDEESADELSSHKTKLPNRGGVNPADVLSQICRETLEKTLTTLKNAIANETNPTKRAEWTRKRKAVESFGSELDGRLLDLSEMLDSNFVLGVQLKNSKRDMMDLRSHLYRVRRERESIALQMDAVRAKHMEEENAKKGRDTINNSLHSLELALDRSQNRPTTEPSSADLEFMLRTVADVSNRGPGARGGLLNQIRAFNAQLESTAHLLERK